MVLPQHAIEPNRRPFHLASFIITRCAAASVRWVCQSNDEYCEIEREGNDVEEANAQEWTSKPAK